MNAKIIKLEKQIMISTYLCVLFNNICKRKLRITLEIEENRLFQL